MILGQIEDREAFWNGLLDPLGELRSRLPILLDRPRQSLLGIPTIDRTEDAADVVCDGFLRLLLRHIGLRILLKMELTPLPFRSRKASGQCRLDSLVSVARDALDAVEAALLEFFEEGPRILEQPLLIVLIAAPLIVQSHGIFLIAYGWTWHGDCRFRSRRPRP